ncbi:MAG: hypothetical protein WC683_14835 [bacterium]
MASPLRRYLRRMWRASLGPQSLLTLAEAVEALPGRRDEARAWLEGRVRPCGRVADVDVYSWGEVVAAMANDVRPREVVRPRSTRRAEVSDFVELVRRVVREESGACAMLHSTELPSRRREEGERTWRDQRQDHASEGPISVLEDDDGESMFSRAEARRILRSTTTRTSERRGRSSTR